jgi:DNA mismatch endonuclease (patch repair protein)
VPLFFNLFFNIIIAMDVLTPQQRHKAMSHIRSKNTSIEVLLRKALWREGVRYRKNVKTLPGTPDIAIKKYKIAIFCDGELWHGKNWETKKGKFQANHDYWVTKIARNITRDYGNEKELEKMGWIVLRFWGSEITKNVMGCVREIKEIIYKVKNGIYNEDEAEFFCAAENEVAYNDYV